MSQALSTAKVQSVREIKKKAKIKKVNKLITKIVIFIVLALILFVIIKNVIIEDQLGIKSIFNSKEEFVTMENGIEFKSISFPIRDALEIIQQDQNYNIAFNSNINDQNYLTEIYNSINIIQSVFSAKGKKNTLIINVVDNENNLINCTSNLGDLYTSKQLEPLECSKLINSEKVLFFVDYPNSSLEKSIVYINVEDKLIQIKPKTKKDLDLSIQLILKGMYSDFENIIDSLNNFKLNNLNSKDVNSNTDLNVINN